MTMTKNLEAEVAVINERLDVLEKELRPGATAYPDAPNSIKELCRSYFSTAALAECQEWNTYDHVDALIDEHLNEMSEWSRENIQMKLDIEHLARDVVGVDMNVEGEGAVRMHHLLEAVAEAFTALKKASEKT